MKKSNVVLAIIMIVAVSLLIVFLPQIYKLSSKVSSNDKKKKIKINSNDKESSSKKQKFDKEVLNDIVFPNLRTNTKMTNSYFSLDKFTVNELSNNDILAVAFKNVHSGYIENHGVEGCASEGKMLKESYLDARIKNIISSSINYTHGDFYVYDTEYAGLWRYDAANKVYIYNGDCDNSAVRYYDLQKIKSYKTLNNNKTLILKVKVAFAKVENGTYTIYKDVNMTEVLETGNYQNLNELNKSLNKLNTNMYTYTYRQGLCTYEAYCLESGEWING